MSSKMIPLNDFEAIAQDILSRSREATEVWNNSSEARSIAAVLTVVRTESGLSQSQVAEKARWDKAFVSRLENGLGGVPDIATISRFAEACGVSANLVFTSMNSAGQTKPITSFAFAGPRSPASPSGPGAKTDISHHRLIQC